MAADRPPAERGHAFLPPQPAGPEPELGGPPPREAPQQPRDVPGSQPPPAAQLGPPPRGAAPAPGHPPDQPFPPPGGQGGPPAPGWVYAPQAAQPDNGPAVTGFVLSLVSVGLLLVTGGLSSIISIGCAIAGIVLSRQGRQKVERGETQKNRGLAQAGYIIGIVGLVLAVLATLVWALVVIGLATSEEFRRDFEDELDGTDSIRAVLRAAAGGVRLLGG
jgi:hypothetical protein